MAVTPVELESLTTKSRFVTLAQKNNAGTYGVAGADVLVMLSCTYMKDQPLVVALHLHQLTEIETTL